MLQGFDLPITPVNKVEEESIVNYSFFEQGWQFSFFDEAYTAIELAMDMEHALKNFQDQKNQDKNLKAELYKDFRSKRRNLTRDASDPATLNCNRTFVKLRNAWQEDETLNDLFEEEAAQVLVDKKAEYFFTPTSIVFIHEYRGSEKK